MHEDVWADARDVELRTQNPEALLDVEAGGGRAGVAPDLVGAGQRGVGENGAQQCGPRTGAADLLEGGHPAEAPTPAGEKTGHGVPFGWILVVQRGHADRAPR